MSNRWVKALLGLITVGVLLFGYSNCGKQFITPEAIVTNMSSLTSGATLFGTGTCDQDLKLLFENGYHTFLKTNCALCHVNGPGKGRFSSPNTDDAFNDFMQTGYAKVSDNAVSASHNPPYSGPQNFQAISTLRLEWEKGQTDYNICKGLPASSGPTVSPSDLVVLQTFDKAIPVMQFNGTSTVQWDLSAELVRVKGIDPLPSLPGAQLSVVIGKYKNSSGATYYTFSQPRIFNSTVDVHVKSLQIKINGTLLSYPTTFRYVNAGIYSGSKQTDIGSLITTGSLVAPGAVSDSDTVTVTFEALEPTTLPPPQPPVIAQFASASMQWVTSTTNFADVEIRLNAAGTVPITVTVSADTSALCGGTTEFTDISACNAPLATFICAGGGCPQARTLGVARSTVGTSYNRFDWDYRFDSSALTFNVGETSKTVRIYFSKDIRLENNRLFTLQIDANLVGAQKGAQDKIYFVFNKLANPTPPVGVPKFSELMQPSGVLGFSCVKCHNSRDLNGGYDMTDYDSMRAKGIVIPNNVDSLMYARMNPSSPLFLFTSPMPIEGQLPVDLRKEVEKWLLNGALNN
jgi:hypothetical protein